MQTMYSAINNSPVTELTSTISASDTTIEVLNGDALPPAPNLAVLGRGEVSEVILYTTKIGNILGGVTRGFDGTTATAWGLNTNVARNYTHYDHQTFIANLEVAQEHIEDENIHVTPTNKSNWNAKATKSDIDNAKKFILTSGTSTAYTVTIETAATNYYRGMSVYIELHTDAGASPTVNVNGFGAKSVNGISKAGFYTLVYDGLAFTSVSGKGGGSNNELNVFAQSVLPDEGYEGIVIAQNFSVSKIMTDNDWYTGGTFSANTTDHVLSHALFKSAAIGNKLYYILSSGTDIYVYDKDTKITSVFVTVSGSGTNQSLISKGTDLYLARLQSTTLHLYKINSLSAIATTLATGTINQTYAQLVDYQDYIYLFTRNFSDSAFGLYKYSIISNTWTNLGLSITAGRQLFVVRKANIAFIFTSDLSNMRMHTYNLDTAVLTTCTLSGFAFANVTLSGAITGDKIYLQPYSTKNLYSIDVSMVGTNYAAVLITNPTTLANSGYVSVSLIDNELWLLNKADSTYLITRYIMDIKIFDANTVIIKRSDQRNGSYSTQLFSNNITGTNNRLLIDFDDVAYYDGTTLLTNFDAYYGNVTDWVKFK